MSGVYECEDGVYLDERRHPRKNVDGVKSFEMDEGDVVVVSYPRAGGSTEVGLGL